MSPEHWDPDDPLWDPEDDTVEHDPRLPSLISDLFDSYEDHEDDD